MRYPRYLCIHGHFYQPPRENPWLGVVEVQDSAAPFHDWNQRITHECYAPNTRARLVDGDGRIINLLNNYAWISFNFGPTLLQWMADESPETLQGIVEADRLSQDRRRGHGNALAQTYNHMILPLASERDKKTQVRWGIADFRHRFGREPEGMWLAETAVNVESLEVLAEAGIRFTILSPRQARRWVRRPGRRSLAASTRRALTWPGFPPAGRSIYSSTTGFSLSKSRSSGCSIRAIASWGGCSRGSTPAAGIPSSCTSPPTANRTDIIMPTATWPWPTCSTGCRRTPRSG
jgi:alpha-amylase/alpha-mannosidase (GH57 family)